MDKIDKEKVNKVIKIGRHISNTVLADDEVSCSVTCKRSNTVLAGC